jgi:peptidoglycan/LPS O-acetylase OafA/YrhL
MSILNISNNRNNNIDLLRGISIILVLLAHFGTYFKASFFLTSKFIELLSRNGYLGVTIFFTISGFLITSHYAKGGQSISTFYKARLSKIYPPLLLLLLINYFLGKFFVIFSTGEFPLKYLYYKIFTYQFNLLYIDGGNKLFVYAVLWSLAIEEVYYLFFPFLFKYLKTKFNIYLIFIILIAIMTFRYFIGIKSLYSYIGCFDALLIGSIAGYISSNNFIYINNIKKYLNIIYILLFLFYISFDIKESFTWLPTIISILSSIFLLAASNMKNFSIKYFILNPIAIMGILSYEIYLFHLPILAIYMEYNFLRFLPGEFALISLMLIMSFISYLIYYFFSKKLYKLLLS